MPKNFVETCYRPVVNPLNPDIPAKQGHLLPLPQGVCFFTTLIHDDQGVRNYYITADAEDPSTKATEIKIIDGNGGKGGYINILFESEYNSIIRELDKSGCPHHTE